MTTTVSEYAHQETVSDVLTVLRSLDSNHLADIGFNQFFNNWCAVVADNGDEKRLPYIGWFWRNVDFARKRIPVGNCGEFIGFMENNKWGHPERMLTEAEADVVIDFLWRAYRADRNGGVLSDIIAARDAILEELWEWMQHLDIPDEEN